MVTIRKYEERDAENVKFACLNAEGYDSIENEETKQLVLHTFCEYYIEREPENCFVVDDDGRAVGFIISSENFEAYKKAQYRFGTDHRGQQLAACLPYGSGYSYSHSDHDSDFCPQPASGYGVAALWRGIFAEKSQKEQK